MMKSFWKWLFSPSNEPKHRRGRRVMTLKEARAVANALRDPNDEGLPFCGVQLPSSAAPLHFEFVGACGSGKTKLMQPLMAKVLRNIRPGSGQRAVILDTKLEMLSFLDSLHLSVPIHILNPLDLRSIAWDLSRDCDSPMVAAQFASILVQEDSSNNRFFADAPREIVRGVLTVLTECLPGWTLRDFQLATSEPDVIRLVLGALDQTAPLIHLLGDDGTARNVTASLAAYLRKYDPLAACWSEATSKLTLEEWIQSESVIVLGFDEKVRTPLSTIYRVFLQRLAEILLAQPDSRDVHTWLFLDEIRHAGNFPGLRPLMTNARSKGVSLCLGFQDVEGMQHAFGEKEANEIIGQCSSIAGLRTQSVHSSEWESKTMGYTEWIERKRTTGPQGTTWTEEIVQRLLVLASQFMSLPTAGPKNGIPGWFTSAAIGTWEGPVPWQDVVKSIPSGGTFMPEFVARPRESQFLKPWTDEERIRISMALSKRGRVTRPFGRFVKTR